MAMGRRRSERQGELWVATAEAARAPRNVFYERLNRVLAEAGFDRFVEDLCEPHYARLGRPGIPPGVYFRMVFVGYFEGIDSQRGIAWRCSDSLSLKAFLGYGPFEETPDHSSLTNVRRRLPRETFDEVFAFVLRIAAGQGLLAGDVLAGDATTLEANAAMKSIVRRDTGDDYEAYVRGLYEEERDGTREAPVEETAVAENAVEAGGDEPCDEDEPPPEPPTEPTSEELRRFDRKRKGKSLSNRDWESGTDPDARIVRMKDGRTRLGYKAEHVIDLETELIVSAEVWHGDRADSATIGGSLTRAEANLRWVERHDVDDEGEFDPLESRPRDAVLDKGYHKAETLANLAARGLRTYVPEREEPHRRRWTDKPPSWHEAVTGNRRRVRGRRGRRLQRLRSERAERSFAHVCNTGGQRRCWVRGLTEANKRYGVAATAHNLGLVMRALYGTGKPREFAAACATALHHVRRHLTARLITFRSRPALATTAA